MNKLIIKNNNSGLYFVDGKGFVGTEKEATQYDESQVSCKLSCCQSFGFNASTQTAPVTVSFAVCYVRSVDTNADGTVKANVKNPSRRRFATREEAQIHGNRFNVRKASFGAAPGSAGHLGFYIIETNDPVTDKVNPKTGLTNPAPGTGGSRFRLKKG